MLFKIAASFLKVGCIGFGGGSALIPVVENEIVKEHGYISPETYTEHTVVANITPGALPVKLGGLAGHKVSGVWGMLLCAALVALPGTAATVLLMVLLSQLGAGAVHQITLASVGISVFIICLLFEYIQNVMRNAKKSGFMPVAIFLMLFSFFVTFGKELREFLTLLFGSNALYSGTPLIDISTIDLLKLAFFVIFFTGGRIKGWRMPVAGVVAAAFLLLFGKGMPFHNSAAQAGIQLLMAALALFVVYDSKKAASGKPKAPDWKSLALQVAGWLGFTALLCLPAALSADGVFKFLADGALSTVTSFGGGEAYLSVADGMFVATGQVAPTVFYGQIVPVANALPGPILVKLLSGVGYVIGFGQGGVLEGLLVAMAGFGVAIGATSVVCILVNAVYTCFTELHAFVVLKQWILPVICGLLCSVMLSMLCEILKVTGESGVISGVAFAAVAGLFVLVRFLMHKLHLNDLLVIAISGGITVLLLNLASLI